MNIAQLHEAIAQVIPDQACIVFRDRRLTWAEVNQRSRRLANLLRSHGLGAYKERSELANWESGQDHVALYLYNGNEYLEGLLGAFKSRCAPFNVNYRYVEEELLYLLDNADTRAVIYQGCFANQIRRIRHRLPRVKLWLQVADNSGAELLDGACDYETELANASRQLPDVQYSGDDLYIVYTGGTTGLPKGVLWRQEDLFYSSLIKGNQRTTIEAIVEQIKSHHQTKKPPIGLPSPPLMHATSQWIAMSLWAMGGTVVLQSKPETFDPDDIWSTIEREQVGSLTIVGDAFAVPLLRQLEKKDYDVGSLRLIVSGGAVLSGANKKAFLNKLPQVTVLDALGSSETGTQASQLVNNRTQVSTSGFAMKEGCVVLNEDMTGLQQPDSTSPGWAARSGYVPLGYYKDEEKTARTFPVVKGIRYSVPGDRALVHADGAMQLLGRDSVTINTGGEKVFAEEVEQAIKRHPSVFDVLVVPTSSDRWGQQVTALVQLEEGASIGEDQLRNALRTDLAGYKIPKAILWVDKIVRAPSGKPDYRWARHMAETMLGAERESGSLAS